MATAGNCRPDLMAAHPAAVVRSYLDAFFSGDIDSARSMVRDEFTFRAPLVEADGSKEMFFAGADTKTRFIGGHRVLRQWDDSDEVSTVYEIDVRTNAGAASLVMHEWHTIVDGRLASSVMLFDTSAPAALLLHDALMRPDR